MMDSHRTAGIDRREAARILLDDPGDLLLVTGLGSTTWDAASVGDRDENFYLWGAMGGAAMVGLGLALARPERRVLVLTGDGEQLMGLGALATVAVQAPPNLAIAVFDNEHYGETGMQRTHTADGVDLSAVALACGFREAFTVRAGDDLATVRRRLREAAGPVLAVFKIAAAKVPLVLPTRDGPWIKNRFRRAVTGHADD
jgi:thiamine pyrophosphate-dependent acetolactate synthase large subunit-like protein